MIIYEKCEKANLLPWCNTTLHMYEHDDCPKCSGPLPVYRSKTRSERPKDATRKIPFIYVMKSLYLKNRVLWGMILFGSISGGISVIAALAIESLYDIPLFVAVIVFGLAALGFYSSAYFFWLEG